MQALTVAPKKIHQTKYGALPHSDMIGRRFGTKVITLDQQRFREDTQATNIVFFLTLNSLFSFHHDYSIHCKGSSYHLHVKDFSFL